VFVHRLTLIMLMAASCGRISESNDARHDAGESCAFEDRTVLMTWSEYCAEFWCQAQPTTRCSYGVTTTVGCGLRVESSGGLEASQVHVFTDAGAFVGSSFDGDLVFQCPEGPPGMSTKVKAGVFPACAQTTCDCIDGGVVCP